MAAPTISQTRLWGNVSKPSIELSGKHGRTPAPAKSSSWIGAKRKRDENAGPKISFSRTDEPISPARRSALSYSLHNPRTLCKTDTARTVPRLSLILRNLSQPSRTLITLHRFFLKAISIHHAHNGPHAPAELGRLLEIVTRLWKERLVIQADIQKMLAIYEINAYAGDGGTKEIPQSLSPFKLVVAGSYISVEYIGDRKEMMGPLSTPFDEKDLHDSYRCHVYDLDSAWTRQRLDHLSFFEEDSLENFTKLQCDIGTQTAARKACVSQQRAEILALSTAAQFREKTISTAMGDENGGDLSHGRPVLQNRKQNLLDRIQAKQIASRANAKPTPPHILRQHALGRIKEVVEVLRMMQHQQKGETKSKLRDETSNEFRSDRGAGRVSFSLTQLRSNIKSSASVPISNEEVTMCLKMLSEELDGTWVRTVKSRGTFNAAFVVVEGQGMSGREAYRRLLRIARPR